MDEGGFCGLADEVRGVVRARALLLANDGKTTLVTIDPGDVELTIHECPEGGG